MPARKIPAKPISKSAVEDVAVGYFKITGSIYRLEETTIYDPSKTAAGLRRHTRRPARMPAVKVSIDTQGYSDLSEFTLPMEFLDKIKLGKTYELQCTLVEVEGDNEDA
jgi:hypothetical protein